MTLDIPGQLNLFNEAELEQNPEAAKAEDLETLLLGKTGKKQKARVTDAKCFKGVPGEKSIWSFPVKINSVLSVIPR